ncbi:MAG: hypothetical protein KatS3mg057_0717 [Herpetosiphonaceae bacterium]|nr:MAG: hypothetical protein KatS3mg057_0717 [Herpetosiphonaceae bacterium]
MATLRHNPVLKNVSGAQMAGRLSCAFFFSFTFSGPGHAGG